ncbi:MAG: ankyrin repeat domain-containing protein [Pseudomonadales bacterium]|jgi:ankyrin repeat protein|nr:ankyrin repeat domain-containing protein [Pseudomonadales bacterium]
MSDKPTLFSPGIGKRGMTALHYAAYCGDLEELSQQLKTGANPNLKDEYRGYTALHWLSDMAATGGPRLEMLRLLVVHGADVNAVSENGETALSLAFEAGNSLGDAMAVELKTQGASG